MSAPSKAELHALADKLHMAIEFCDQSGADRELAEMARLAREYIGPERERRDQMAAERQAAALAGEPGLGGHRWYLPDDGRGASWRCASCSSTRVGRTAMERGIVPPCGDRCDDGAEHFVTVDRDPETLQEIAIHCLYCKTVYTAEQVTA